MSEKNLWTLVLVLAVLAGFALWASVGGYMSGMMGIMHGWGFVGLLPLVVVGLLAVGAYVGLTELKQPRAVDAPALRIVNERYARGEFTREQYLQMKWELDA